MPLASPSPSDETTLKINYATRGVLESLLQSEKDSVDPRLEAFLSEQLGCCEEFKLGWSYVTGSKDHVMRFELWRAGRFWDTLFIVGFVLYLSTVSAGSGLISTAIEYPGIWGVLGVMYAVGGIGTLLHITANVMQDFGARFAALRTEEIMMTAIEPPGPLPHHFVYTFQGCCQTDPIYNKEVKGLCWPVTCEVLIIVFLTSIVSPCPPLFFFVLAVYYGFVAIRLPMLIHKGQTLWPSTGSDGLTNFSACTFFKKHFWACAGVGTAGLLLGIIPVLGPLYYGVTMYVGACRLFWHLQYVHSKNKKENREMEETNN